jgi:cysteine desulfurase
MMPYFGAAFGNAASRTHRYGWEAEKAVEQARHRVAELMGAEPRQIVFTSGATESVNLALKGVMDANAPGSHMVAMATEHRAALDSVRRLEKSGFFTTVLPPRPDGLVDLVRLREAIRPETVLVSVMHANNETGTVQPVEAIGALCRECGVLFHCDAAQAFGKIPVNAREADLMSFSAHKICGPKGVGALFVRRGVRVEAQMDGGGHEFGLRSGTLNVPAIVGFGEACRIAALEMADEARRVGALRDRLWARLEAALPGLEVNGSTEHRLPGNLNAAFAGVDAGALLMSLPDVALSTGSACSSAIPEPSHVLRALGLSAERARASVRFGLGRFNTEDEINYAAGKIIEAVERLRKFSPASSSSFCI